jgi:hypothetical protein
MTILHLALHRALCSTFNLIKPKLHVCLLGGEALGPAVQDGSCFRSWNTAGPDLVCRRVGEVHTHPGTQRDVSAHSGGMVGGSNKTRKRLPHTLPDIRKARAGAYISSARCKTLILVVFTPKIFNIQLDSQINNLYSTPSAF